MNVIKFRSLPFRPLPSHPFNQTDPEEFKKKEKEIMYRSSYRRRLRHHHLRQPASLSIIDA
jgi:hypothetical protein